jgi:hypothetical protein
MTKNNIDYRLQTFYKNGYNDAITDINGFINALSPKFNYLKFNNKITATEFLNAVLIQINELYSKGLEKDKVNGK